jgi:hypothetical protein
MNRSEQITLNGFLVWAYVVELEGGLRMRISLDEWEQLGLYRGQQVPIERDGHQGEQLFLAEVVKVPPIVWVVMANRIQAAA